MPPYRQEAPYQQVIEDEVFELEATTSAVHCWCTRKRLLTLLALSLLSILIIGILVGVLGHHSSTHSYHKDRAVVHTTSGFMQGQAFKDGFVFTGMPYAQPPVDEDRWKPPRPILNDAHCQQDDVCSAENLGNICPQLERSTGTVIGDEDCLYMNVWTTSLALQAGKLPVIVSVHCGELLHGSGTEPGCSPSLALANKLGAVLVSFNYRLGPLGFIPFIDEGPSGNFGLLDQVQALKWVRSNIDNFGGDQNLVSVIGCSSVHALLLSPLTKDLFQRAWVASAAPLFEKTWEDAVQEEGIGFLGRLHCPDRICALRSNLTQIMFAMPAEWLLATDNANLPQKTDVPRQAMIIVDGDVLPHPSPVLWKQGNTFSDVPVIFSNMAEESAFAPMNSSKNWTSVNLEQDEYLNQTIGTFGPNVTRHALLLYATQPEQDDPEFMYISMASDLRFICPMSEVYKRALRRFSNPVYRMISTIRPSQPTSKGQYASRGLDLKIFFSQDVLPKAERIYQTYLHDKIIMPFVHDAQITVGGWKVETGDENIAGDLDLHQNGNTLKPIVAVINDTIHLVHSYHNKQCEFWRAQGFSNYTWVH